MVALSGRRWNPVAELDPSLPLTRPSTAQKLRRPIRRARQLNEAEVRELTEGYQRGLGVNDLAARFGVNRKTVSAHLERQGVPRRYRLLSGDVLDDAVGLYEAGLSLVDVGARLSVSPNTVLNALRTAGVSRRPVGTNGR